MFQPTRAFLKGQRIDQEGEILGVFIRNVGDGIQFEVPCTADNESSRFTAEKQIESVCNVIRTAHHLTDPLVFDRSHYLQARSRTIWIQPQVIEFDSMLFLSSEIEKHGNRLLIETILNMLSRTDQESDWMNKFSMLWMTFSMLYREVPENTEQQQISNFLKHYHFRDDEFIDWTYQRIHRDMWFDHFGRAALKLGKKGQREISTELQAMLQERRLNKINGLGDETAFLSIFLLSIYAYRCMIFHGEESAMPTTRPMLTKLSAQTLDFLLRCWIQKQLGQPVSGPKTQLNEIHEFKYLTKGEPTPFSSPIEIVAHMMNNPPKDTGRGENE